MATPNASPVDSLDLEMDALPLPTWARNAIDALDGATSRNEIARVIEPLRAQPEGEAKTAVRAALAAAQARITAPTTAPAAPTLLTVLALVWVRLWGMLGQGVTGRPSLVRPLTALAPIPAPIAAPVAVAAPVAAPVAVQPQATPHAARWIPVAGSSPLRFQALTTGPVMPRPVVGSRLRVVTKGGKVAMKYVASIVDARGAGTLCEVSDEPIAAPVAAPVEIAAESAQEPTSENSTLLGDLTSIATEGASNAATTTAGSLAGGQLRGVGFSSAQGYVTALAHGVKLATADIYLNVLRDQFHYSAEQRAALTVTIIPESTLPVGPGITHTPSGVNAMDMTPAQRRALWKTTATPTATSNATITKAPLLKAGELIMGSIAAGQGAACSWSRARHAVNVPANDLYAALVPIGRSDIAPRLKSSKAQFGDVMSSLNHNGLTARAATKAESVKQGSTWAKHIVSRWIVGSVDFTAALGSLGDKTLVAELTEAGEIQFTGDELIAARVRSTFAARVAGNVYDSTDLIQWFERVLRIVHHGVTWGGMVYVPAGEVEAVKELVGAIKSLMGRSFAVACVTTEEGLIAGLADGLLDEVADIERKLITAQGNAAERELKKAAAAGGDAAAQELAARRAVILTGAASTLLRECGDVGERITGYTTMLGEAATKFASARLAALRSKIEPLVDDTSARFAALDLD